MKTKKIITAVILAAGLLFGDSIRAQTNAEKDVHRSQTDVYTTAIGLRAGVTSGLTIKHFLTSGNAVEGIIGIWPNAMSVTGLYERYNTTRSERLNWYYGGGGHLGVRTGRIYYINEGSRYYRYYNNELGIGIDGILGMEYKIPVIPVALSIDMKPFIEINSGGYAYFYLDPGVGIKVVF